MSIAILVFYTNNSKTYAHTIKYIRKASRTVAYRHHLFRPHLFAAR
jgi:hypothetical protein